MLISRPLGVGLLGLALCACSVLPITPAATPPAAVAQATAPPPIVVVTATPALSPTTPTELVPAPTELGQASISAYLPVTWAETEITGTLVFLTATASLNNDNPWTPTLVTLDLATGALRTLFTAPPDTILSSGSLSPDGQHLALTYAPPPVAGQTQYGFPGLYLLPGDGQGEPQALLDRTADRHAFFQPSWSPDSAYIYYTHYDPHLDGSSWYTPTYSVERWNLSQGVAQVIAANAYWPRLSGDGALLVYVTLDATNTRNELYVAAPDGSGARRIDLPEGLIVDVPLFSPDNQWIYFSAADLSFPAANWLDRLMGVETVEAAPEPHSIPSDWWRVPVAGGQAEQITELYGTALYGAFSRDGRYLAFVNWGGLYLTDPLGQDVRPLVTNTMLVGTLDWIQ